MTAPDLISVEGWSVHKPVEIDDEDERVTAKMRQVQVGLDNVDLMKE